MPRGRENRERAAADRIRASRLVRGPGRATSPALVGRHAMEPADAPRTQVVATAPPGTDRARQPGRADHRHRGDRQHQRKRQAGRQRFRHRRPHRHGNTEPGAGAPRDEYEDKAKESPGHRAGDHPGASGDHPGTRGDRFRRLRQRPPHLRTATRRATKAPAANPANTGAMPTMGHQGWLAMGKPSPVKTHDGRRRDQPDPAGLDDPEPGCSRGSTRNAPHGTPRAMPLCLAG